MKQEESIRNIAIERHDIDAPFFQKEYETAKSKYADEFVYGRQQINEELELLVKNLDPGARILDMGSGTGHLANFLKQKHIGFSWIIKRRRKRYGKYQYRN